MKNKNQQDDYAKIRARAKEDYKKISNIWCPHLKGNVIFNSEGFRHLNQKKGIFRSKAEQKKRFALLGQTQSILEDTSSIVEHQKRSVIRKIKWQGKTINKSSIADYWIFTKNQDNKTIKLVIRKFDQGQKHFLTIYEVDKKEKPLH